MTTKLAVYRLAANATQAEMANAMGMPLRSYQALEGSENPVRPVHIKAAEMALIEIAVEKGNPDAVPSSIRTLVDDAAKLIHSPVRIFFADGTEETLATMSGALDVYKSATKEVRYALLVDVGKTLTPRDLDLRIYL